MSKLASLDDLFVLELQEAYHAEGQILNVLPEMVAAATSLELKSAFQGHRQQTELHVRRLEQVLRQLRLVTGGSPCEGMKGLLAEAGKIIAREAEPDVRDAALIAVAQKVEHYEIASYGCLCTYAEMLGYDQAYQLLGKTLDEEETTDMQLTELAEAVINPRVVEGEKA